MVKDPSTNAGDVGSIPGMRKSLEKEIATNSRILAWEIPWTQETGGLKFRHNLATKNQQITLRPQCLLRLSRMKRFLNLRHNIKAINFKVRGRKLSFIEKPVSIRYYG